MWEGSVSFACVHKSASSWGTRGCELSVSSRFRAVGLLVNADCCFRASIRVGGAVLGKIIRVYCNARVTPPTLATQFGPPPRAGPPFPCPPHLHHFPIHATHNMEAPRRWCCRQTLTRSSKQYGLPTADHATSLEWLRQAPAALASHEGCLERHHRTQAEN